ncbi:VOMI family protein [Pseudomonas caricapapayae]|uniref:VOMI protein n=1 Tax=Pseudomonas caricapapayae TaxID=46678 RepID=A0A0P9PH11_9PSED|nr:metallophosphoesterase [Pseudomonas caricapapayae]KPW56329.1 VOMI family protein [Pseudomonas caricapapayae]RMM06656.1 VOMI protein [Pseudomonas caricapapayae]RMV91361.1 VOMI protein [Pseudomonas caricapapayae]
MSNHRIFLCALFSTLLLMSGCANDVENENAVASAGGVEPKGIIRHIIFASDPQYPWSKDEKNAEDSLGALLHPQSQDVPLQPRSSVNAASNEDLVRNQYNAIQKWRAGAMGGVANNPVIINGDMTAFGHGWQREFLYGALSSALSTNWYFGLGNHDYSNNVGECQNDGCARDSMNDLIGRMGGNNMDYSLDYGGGLPATKKYSGSFAYYKDFGRVRYIQLNLDPSYVQWFYSAGVPLHSSKYEFDIQSPVENGWLENVLKNAVQQKKFVIIGMHDPAGWTYSPNPRTQYILDQFRKLLKVYDVSAIFAGHFHAQAGAYPSPYEGVPVFLSGSATEETFLIVDIDENGKFFQTWLVKNNNPQTAQYLGALPLKLSTVVPSVDEYDNSGHWGTWGGTEFCNPSTYIRGFKVRAEKWINGDNTAVNAINMNCSTGKALKSKEGLWGDWYETVNCPSFKPVVGFQLKMEGGHGDGDDTAVASARLVCEGGQYIAAPYDTGYGT